MPRTDAPPRPPKLAGQKPIDFEELIDRCMGRLELAERILGRFREAAEAEMQALREASERSDRDAIERIAHRVAGGALAVSANPLADYSRRLEREAASGEADNLEVLVTQTLEACCAALDSIINRSAEGNRP